MSFNSQNDQLADILHIKTIA